MGERERPESPERCELCELREEGVVGVMTSVDSEVASKIDWTMRQRWWEV